MEKMETIANEMSKFVNKKIDPNSIVEVKGDGIRGKEYGFVWDVYATRSGEHTIIANVYDNGEIRVAIA